MTLASASSSSLPRSLMNYMAFNRKNHRIFHPKEVPPPPSSPPPPPHGDKPALEFQSKANLDAQMVAAETRQQDAWYENHNINFFRQPKIQIFRKIQEIY